MLMTLPGPCERQRLSKAPVKSAEPVVLLVMVLVLVLVLVLMVALCVGRGGQWTTSMYIIGVKT